MITNSPLEQVNFGAHTAGPRRANDRAHGNEEVTSMQAQPTGLCECGCGRTTPIASATRRAKGHVKGQHTRFALGHNPRCGQPDYEVLPNGCWRWLKHIDAYGYGSMDGGARAHRVYYERIAGPIQEGFELDHTCCDGVTCPGGIRCPHRRCVNPSHLEPVTHAENMRRSVWFGGRTPGRDAGAVVRAARVALNLSQVELGRLIPCSSATISLIENGKQGLGSFRERLSEVLAVEL